MDNLQEQFYQMMTRLKSRAASAPKDDVMDNRNDKRGFNYQTSKEISRDYQSNQATISEPQVIDLQGLC